METAQISLHLKERFLSLFAGSLGVADSGLVAAAVADLGSDTADLETVQTLATVVEAHLLHHQIHRDLQERQSCYGADKQTIREEL